MRSSLLAFVATQTALSLNNGVGRLPALGWSSWYCSPGGSQVTSEFVRANANVLISSGLAAKGYVYVNVDEGWLKGRYANNDTIYEDLVKFPEGLSMKIEVDTGIGLMTSACRVAGMKGLGDWIHSQETAPGSGNFMRCVTCSAGRSEVGPH